MSAADSVLASIFSGCVGKIEIRPLPPGRYPARFFSSSSVHDAERYAYSLDGKADVYFGAGTRRCDSGTKDDVQEIPALWADCDTPEAVAKVPTFRLPPTIEIETSPGRRQLWWLLKEPLLLEHAGTIVSVERVLRGIAHILGSDPSVAEVARIMRVPGTKNVKRGARCCLLRDDGPRYDLDDFIAAGIYHESETTPAGNNGHSDQDAISEGHRNTTLASFAGTMRRRGMSKPAIEAALLEENVQRCTPPLPEAEVRGISMSIARYAPADERAPREGDDAPVENWPHPPAAAAYHGVLGEIVRVIEPHTEADPVAVLAQALVGFGSLVGGAPHFRVEATEHRVHEFLALVGRTAGGRKGTSWDQARRVLAAVDQEWAEKRIMGGLSSGEGLIHEVRDGREEQQARREKNKPTTYEIVEVDPGVADKRLLVYEPELARVLKVAMREGSTLSTTIRQAWDGPLLRVIARTTGAVATGAHVSIVSHITAEELLRQLQDTEAASGFGNRFLWLAVRRARLLPEGGDLDPVILVDLQNKIRAAAEEARKGGEMRRDDEARALWHKEYERLTTGRAGLLGAMCSRAEAHVLRLSMIYALADASLLIRRPHLEAALALWGYSERSAAFVFGNSLGDPTADEILRALRAAGPKGMTRTEIRKHFAGNKSAAEIGRALAVLVRESHAHSSTDKGEGPGRPTEVWRTGSETS